MLGFRIETVMLSAHAPVFAGSYVLFRSGCFLASIGAGSCQRLWALEDWLAFFKGMVGQPLPPLPTVAGVCLQIECSFYRVFYC